jgi:hypothetical protein
MNAQATTVSNQALRITAPAPSHMSDTSAYDCCLLNPLEDSSWDRLVASHSEAHVFHSTAWAKVLCKSYRHKPFYLHFSKGSDTIALVPLMEVASIFTGRRGVCLPFSDLCGPLLFEESARIPVINKLSDLAKERKWKYFELRSGNKPTTSAVPSSRFYGHRIDLRCDADQLFDRFNSSVRRAIRKASSNGLTVDVTSTRESLLAFYGLHVKTRRRHGLPPQSPSFFSNIHEEIIKQGLGFVVLAQSGSRAVAAAVFFRLGGKALYKYAASDDRYQELRGNDLVMWEGIKFLMQQGCADLHLGRTSLESDGLRRFKRGWGASEEGIDYFRFDAGANSWLSMQGPPGALHKKVFGRLPLALNKLAGAMIYPHLD